MSGSIFASDQAKEIGTLKTRYTSTLERIGEEPSPDSILSAPVIGFAYGKQKLHKTLDVLRGNEARLLNQRAEAMPRDDPRAEALLCGGHCPFANRFPLTISQHLRFTAGEFTTALAARLGLDIRRPPGGRLDSENPAPGGRRLFCKQL